jgi:DNA-binding transcriptional LysR family regulator
LSKQIKVLEEELGAMLFERSNRHVELTAAGKALLPEARALLAQAERAEQIPARVKRGEIGELRIGFTSGSALIQPITQLIFSYRQKFAGVRLRIEELTTSEQLNAMLERRLDFAFVRGTVTPDLPSSLQALRIVEDSLVVALPFRHSLASSKSGLAVSVLSEEPFVMYPRESGTGVYDQIMLLCRRAGFAPRVGQEARSAATIVGLVAGGLGVSLVPESFQGIATNGVAYRPLKEKEARSAMWLISRTGTVSLEEEAFSLLANAIHGSE